MGKNIGRYQIKEHLGEGATANVYAALDTVLEREVVLKLLKPALIADSISFKRFQQEAKAVARLFHPHITMVYDMGEVDSQVFIIMYYVRGQSLADIIQEGPLPVDETIKMVNQMGEALDFAHQKGFLHRDIKPSNILRDEEGEYWLTDFGLAKALMTTGMSTNTGAILGTPAYIPPEIWLGKEALPATDQYALACVTYEALTGKILFSGPTPPAVMTQHVLGEIDWSGDEIDQAMLGVLSKALEKDPGSRFTNLQSFSNALRLAAAPGKAPGSDVPGKEKQDVGQTARSIVKESARSTTTEGVKGRRPPASKPDKGAVGPQTGDDAVTTYRPEPINETETTRVPLANGIFMEFVRVPAGKFLMGAARGDLNKNGNPGSQRIVNLEEFWIGKFPVTNRQYVLFNAKHRFNLAKGDHPVTNVTWIEAQNFCAWLADLTRLDIRLPFVAEWEKAARGTDGRRYPWGDQAPSTDYANFGGRIGESTPVDKFPQGASPYGVYDMAGNVWEWIDSMDGEVNSNWRVLRGGSWADNAYLLVTYNSTYASMDTKLITYGFRCVLKKK